MIFVLQKGIYSRQKININEEKDGDEDEEKAICIDLNTVTLNQSPLIKLNHHMLCCKDTRKYILAKTQHREMEIS